ncbi:MAG: hypothetical protein RL373_28 [Pseudomonadota bacterium]|jgi:hypothetical protein
MNPYELADRLEASLTNEYDCDDLMKYAAVLLRGLNNDNQRLKAVIDEAKNQYELDVSILMKRLEREISKTQLKEE